MAVPIIYNLQSIKAPWATAIVAVAGIVRDSTGRPVISAEAVVIISLPKRDTGTDANVQLHGVSEDAVHLRDAAKLVEGRFFQAGTAERVVGRGVQQTFRGLQMGDRPKIGGRKWQVVGIFDAGGSAFDSELWGDAEVVVPTFNRPLGVYESVTVRLTSPQALQHFKDALTADPRLKVTVERERDYYEKQSGMVATLIRRLGFLVAFVMGIGAVFGALNTMYSAVAARGREIATLRALGFRSGSILASFVLESLIIAFIGGVLGCTGSLGLNGMSVSTGHFDRVCSGDRSEEGARVVRGRRLLAAAGEKTDHPRGVMTDVRPAADFCRFHGNLLLSSWCP